MVQIYFPFKHKLNVMILFQSLTAVRFCSTSLVSLSLVGCRAITALELTCPYLEQVSLDGCDHLESAAFFPVSENDHWLFLFVFFFFELLILYIMTREMVRF